VLRMRAGQNGNRETDTFGCGLPTRAAPTQASGDDMRAIELVKVTKVTGYVRNGRIIIRHPNGVIEIKAPAPKPVPACVPDHVTDCEPA
jgi:hypothetical protein